MAETKTKAKKYIEAIGRRKTSTARVRLTPSGAKTTFTINGKEGNIYFPTTELRSIIRGPFETKDTAHFDVEVKVSGGGIHSQAEAVRHGISRALVEEKEEVRGELKKLGYLKRDPRAKERRKFGLKKARKAPQWSKR